MVAVVGIHLCIMPEPTPWVEVLSIPCEDIQRLTCYPLKWLCFAVFAVCGAKGHLSATKEGESVDYEGVSFNNLADKYYYNTSDPYHFIDYQVLNDRCSSSQTTPRVPEFRDQVCRRDGYCVFTQAGPALSDASHIIARSKGDDYIAFVIRDRLDLYPDLSSNQNAIGINSIQNGILLRADLHRMFGEGEIAFLRTPNFGMKPTDVPQAEMEAMATTRTTLQHMKSPGKFDIPQVDAKPLSGWQEEEPSSILLDFVYGAIVAQHWMSTGLLETLEKRFQDAFQPVLTTKPKPPSPEDGSGESEDEPDDPKDLDYKPPGSKTTGYKMDHMDRILALSWLLKGVTPQSLAEEARKQEQERELHAQKCSCDKVQQWLDSGVSTTL